MKSRQILLGLLLGIFLWSGGGWTASAEEDRCVPWEEARLASIFLRYGGYNAPISMELTATEEGALAVLEGMGTQVTTLLPLQILDQAQALMDCFGVWDWDGFRGVVLEEMILDGEGFDFHARLADGREISACGENCFPEHYGAFRYAMTLLLQPVFMGEQLPYYARPILDTAMTRFALAYQTESKELSFPFECTLELRPDRDNAPYLKASLRGDAFDIAPGVQDNLADDRRGAWFDFYGQVPPPPFAALQALVEQYGVARWNGFQEQGEDKGEAPALRLFIGYASGESIVLEGRAWPEGVEGFVQEATEEILQYIRDNRDSFVPWE